MNFNLVLSIIILIIIIYLICNKSNNVELFTSNCNNSGDCTSKLCSSNCNIKVNDDGSCRCVDK